MAQQGDFVRRQVQQGRALARGPDVTSRHLPLSAIHSSWPAWRCPQEGPNPYKLYENVYCARGEMENRIKECQLDLFADRTSATVMRANQLRLWFASMAYVLLSALRRIALPGTRLARATCASIRNKLLKNLPRPDPGAVPWSASAQSVSASPWRLPVLMPTPSPRLTGDYAADLSPRPRNRPPANNKKTSPGSNRASAATDIPAPSNRKTDPLQQRPRHSLKLARKTSR